MAYSAFSGLNSGNAGIKKVVRQSNDFSAGDAVRLDGANYVKAQANSAVNAEVVGVIEAGPNANQFTVVFAGEVNLGDDITTTSGSPYFLRADQSGTVDPTPPLTTGTIKKTVYIGTGGNRAIVVNYLGLLNGFEGGDQVSLTGVSPVGQIIPYAGPVTDTGAIPNGWLLCDGGQFSSSDYPELALLVGDIYGTRSGVLFRLPDLRGRTPVGVNQNNAVVDANPLFGERIIGSMAGLEEVQLSNDELPNHAHGASYVAFVDDKGIERESTLTPDFYYGPSPTDPTTPPEGSGSENYRMFDGSGPIIGNDWQFWDYGNDDHNYGKVAVPSTVETQGGGAAHTNMQPFLVTNWLVRADSKVSAAILTVNAQDMADVDSAKAYDEQAGGVLMFNGANDSISPLNAKGGEDKFIINPVSNSERNILINGNFDIWQRGTGAFAAGSENWVYSADRWFHAQNAGYTVTGDTIRGDVISSDTPFSTGRSNVPCTHSIAYRNTSTATDFAAGDYNFMGQLVEGFNYASLWSAGYMTVSFWIKTQTAGVYNLAFRNRTYNRSYVAEYSVNQANVWEWKTITVPIDTQNPTLWNFTDGVGLRLEWSIGKCGGTYETTTPNNWQAGSYHCTPSAVNAVATASGTGINFQLAQCQLEAGRIATPFQPRRIEDELTKCERYYEKSYDLGVVPGTVSYDGSIHSNDWVVSNTAHINASFRARKRIKPAVTIYNPKYGTKNNVYMLHRESGTSENWNVSTVGRGTTNIYNIVRSSGSYASGYKNKLNFHYVADSELRGE